MNLKLPPAGSDHLNPPSTLHHSLEAAFRVANFPSRTSVEKMTANMVPLPGGELPWTSSAEGSCTPRWSLETAAPVQAMFARESMANSDRGDDYEALKEAAIKRLKRRKRKQAQHTTVVLPTAGVGLPDCVHSQLLGSRPSHPHRLCRTAAAAAWRWWTSRA